MATQPIKVILGGKEYEIQPLVIAESRKWRAQLVEALKRLPQVIGKATESPEELQGALSNLFVAIPDSVIDLFFAYAKGLNKERIEEVATDAEMAKAFDQVVQLEMPLVTAPIKFLTMKGDEAQ